MISASASNGAARLIRNSCSVAPPYTILAVRSEGSAANLFDRPPPTNPSAPTIASNGLLLVRALQPWREGDESLRLCLSISAVDIRIPHRGAVDAVAAFTGTFRQGQTRSIGGRVDAAVRQAGCGFTAVWPRLRDHSLDGALALDSQGIAGQRLFSIPVVFPHLVVKAVEPLESALALPPRFFTARFGRRSRERNRRRLPRFVLLFTAAEPGGAEPRAHPRESRDMVKQVRVGSIGQRAMAFAGGDAPPDLRDFASEPDPFEVIAVSAEIPQRIGPHAAWPHAAVGIDVRACPTRIAGDHLVLFLENPLDQVVVFDPERLGYSGNPFEASSFDVCYDAVDRIRIVGGIWGDRQADRIKLDPRLGYLGNELIGAGLVGIADNLRDVFPIEGRDYRMYADGQIRQTLAQFHQLPQTRFEFLEIALYAAYDVMFGAHSVQ